MNKSECWEKNLIDGGFCAPFVAVGDDGRIYVGDEDNLDSFSTVAEAIAHCEGAVLAGAALETAQRAHDGDYRNNEAAEYHWHCDALAQIDALRNFPTAP